MCSQASSELACNDDISTTEQLERESPVGRDAGHLLPRRRHEDRPAGAYDLNVEFLAGEGDPCATGDDCGPGLVCRVPLGGSAKVCAKHVCQDGVDDDGDGKNDYPDDPGCAAPTDDDETDDCPSGPNCPECGDGATTTATARPTTRWTAVPGGVGDVGGMRDPPTLEPD